MTTPVTPFHAHLPVRIAFGDGVLAELRGALAALGSTAALVVVEEPVAEHASVADALASAESAGLRLDRVVKGPGEPTFALADELADRVRDGSLDVVVGIGGGSALDVAKAARIVADQGGAVSDYAGGIRTPAPPRLGLVLCPTTAGTGSEVSGASVLTDTDADRKVGFGHPNMRAQHALVDPVLTHGLPAGPTAHSGVDALAQAIGACTVRNSSPLSVAFGLEACHHVAHSLREAVADGTDAEARRRMACASLTAGLAMNLSDCAADHALGPGTRQRRAPPAWAHGRARGRGDARALTGRLRRAPGADRRRARRVSRRQLLTARAPSGRFVVSSPMSASRRSPRAASWKARCPRSSRARPASSPTTSRSTATRGTQKRSKGPFAPRSPSRPAELRLRRDEDALQLRVVGRALLELPADARRLVAAERRLREHRVVRVDADRARPQCPSDAELARAVPRPQRARETIQGVCRSRAGIALRSSVGGTRPDGDGRQRLLPRAPRSSTVRTNRRGRRAEVDPGRPSR